MAARGGPRVAKRSAGLLLFRRTAEGFEVLLAHPGGPFWAKRDAGAWTLPKGEIEPDENAPDAARREFREETGHTVVAPLIALGEITQAGGKRVVGYAAEGDLDPEVLSSNTFSTEWPPRSGRYQDFPEVDRVAWFPPDEAQARLLAAQAPFVDRLRELLALLPA